MFVTVIHEIQNPEAFFSKGEEVLGKSPKNLKALQFLPSADRKRAVSREADTIDNLKRFLESKIGSSSKDTYFAIDAKVAVGLPQKQPA